VKPIDRIRDVTAWICSCVALGFMTTSIGASSGGVEI
jgi:hypothetical protein